MSRFRWRGRFRFMSKWAISHIMFMGLATGMGMPITSGCRDIGAGIIITASGSMGITGRADSRSGARPNGNATGVTGWGRKFLEKYLT